MQVCMQKYPTLYNKDLADDDEISQIAQAESEARKDEASNKVPENVPENNPGSSK